MNILLWISIAFVVYLFLRDRSAESFATSPATLIQLAASSGYYPFWRYGYGYMWPYYRYLYPYYGNHPTYSSYYRDAQYPRPAGWYKRDY